MFNGISIGFCTLGIMGLTLHEHIYKDMCSFTIEVMKNRYFMLMGIIGGNLAMIGNELLLDNK